MTLKLQYDLIEAVETYAQAVKDIKRTADALGVDGARVLTVLKYATRPNGEVDTPKAFAEVRKSIRLVVHKLS